MSHSQIACSYSCAVTNLYTHETQKDLEMRKQRLCHDLLGRDMVNMKDRGRGCPELTAQGITKQPGPGLIQRHGMHNNQHVTPGYGCPALHGLQFYQLPCMQLSGLSFPGKPVQNEMQMNPSEVADLSQARLTTPPPSSFCVFYFFQAFPSFIIT